MSHRMGVLSRRLERCAVAFAVATFGFFFAGLYASAKTEGQVVFFCAGLVLVCLFASVLLWLAHGFAWAMIPEEPVGAMKPDDAIRPREAMRPADPTKPEYGMKPEEAMKAVEQKKPAEEKVIPSGEDPPDAKYTITGRRIY